MHLADAFITSDLYCIGDIHFDRLSIPHAWRAIAAIYCLSYRNAVRINTYASRNNFSFVLLLSISSTIFGLAVSSAVRFTLITAFWITVQILLMLLISFALFFLFLCFSFYFFLFHILCLFPSVLSVLISSGGSVTLRVVFWLECGGGLEFRWRAAGHHEGVWSDVSSGVSPAPLDPQANPNSSKTCSLKITMPLILAAFDSSDDSD